MLKKVAALLCAAVSLCTPVLSSAEPESRQTSISASPMYDAMYQVVVEDAADASEVLVPTWTERNGQDDLVWYEAHKNADGAWSAEIDTSCHGGGSMVSHAYADGICVGGVTYEAPVPGWTGVLALPEAGSAYKILISNLWVPAGVRIAAWSAAYGQDDLAWYEARCNGSGVWSAEVDPARHGGGDMICHVYGGDRVVGGVTFTAPAALPTARTEMQGGTRYDVVIENLWGVSEVEVPTWGTAGGQDDIFCYRAVKTAPGTWRASINAASHDEGTIESHVYADGVGITNSIRMTREFVTIRDQNGRSSGTPALSSLSRKKDGWGSGGPKDSLGRSEGAVSYQQRFGHYDADFIAPASNRIYLTFDEGYENSYTPKILDTLKAKNVKAVFFVTYPFVKENPDLVRRMIAEGHQIGNHSTTHSSFPGLSDSRVFDEIMRLHRLMLQQFDYDMTLLRLPSGEFCERDLALAQTLGYRSVFWSFGYLDWDPKRQIGASAALRKLEQNVHPGAIYLLHAVSRDNAGVLGDFIDYCRGRGYELAAYDLT